MQTEERLYLQGDPELGVRQSDYGEGTAGVFRRHVGRYESAAAAIANHPRLVSSVLDIACGSGYGAKLLPVHELVGVDRDQTAIAFASKHYQINGNLFLCQDVFEALCEAGEGTMDAIVSIETVEHLPRELQTDFLKETHKRLSPYGLFFVTCPVRGEGDPQSGNPFHLYEPTLDEFLCQLNELYSEVRMDLKPIYTTVGAEQQMGEFTCCP